MLLHRFLPRVLRASTQWCIAQYGCRQRDSGSRGLESSFSLVLSMHIGNVCSLLTGRLRCEAEWRE